MNESPYPLAMTRLGDRVWVREFRGGRSLARRLTHLGIAQGMELTVVSRSETGSVIVGFQGCRIGVGAGIAHRIWVTSSHSEARPNRNVTGSNLIGEPPMTMSAKVPPNPAPLHLGALEVGQSCRLLGYEPGSHAYRGKLLSMGFIPGTKITVTRQAPLGDPVEVEVRGYKLSLRKGEAAVLKVEVLDIEVLEEKP